LRINKTETKKEQKKYKILFLLLVLYESHGKIKAFNVLHILPRQSAWYLKN